MWTEHIARDFREALDEVRETYTLAIEDTQKRLASECVTPEIEGPTYTLAPREEEKEKAIHSVRVKLAEVAGMIEDAQYDLTQACRDHKKVKGTDRLTSLEHAHVEAAENALDKSYHFFQGYAQCRIDTIRRGRI